MATSRSDLPDTPVYNDHLRLAAVPFFMRFLLPVTDLVPRLDLRPGDFVNCETQRHFGCFFSFPNSLMRFRSSGSATRRAAVEMENHALSR